MRRCILLVAAIWWVSCFGTTANSQQPPQAALCGKVSTTNFLTCAQVYGAKNVVTCTSSGRCDNDDKCVARPGFTTVGQNTFPVNDWNKKFFTVEEDNGPNAQQIKSTINKCFELLNCKDDCVLAAGSMRCSQGTTMLSDGRITEFKENGPCNPPPPPPGDEPPPEEIPVNP